MDAGAVIEAVVVAGTVETPYRRAGRGATVLVLGAPWLFDELTETMRVVEPLRLPPARIGEVGAGGAGDGAGPPEDTAWREWLQGLVDGLGLDRPAIAVGPQLEAAARQAVARDPDRFGPVVVAGTASQVRTGLAAADDRGRHEIIDA